MKSFKNMSMVYFGEDVALHLGDLLLANNFRNPLIVIDKNIENSAYLKTIIAVASKKIELETKFFSLDFEPSYDDLDKISLEIQNKSNDCFVGIGGGSTCDLVKGLSVLSTNPSPSIQYRGLNKVKFPGKPIILIPSTAGTGSEATKTASFIDRNENKKLGINGNFIDTLFAILDPKIVMTCPPSVKISAGLDALLHAVEALTARSATVLSKIHGTQAFKLLFENFPLIMDSTTNEEAYLNMLLGSYLAGVAMFNAAGGPASGISYPLGVHYHIPHGIAGGIFLQHVFEYNVRQGYDGYDDLYVILTNDIREKHKGERFIQLFKEFYRRIGAPQKLNDFQIGRRDIPEIVKLTMEQRTENLKINPIEFNQNAVHELLNDVLD